MNEDDNINYTFELLKHPVVSSAGLISIILGFLLSMIVGATGFFAPPLLFLTFLFLSVLFVSDSPVFQDGVKRKAKAAEREKNRSFFLNKLMHRKKTEWGHAFPVWNNPRVKSQYFEMMDELKSLNEIAANSQSSISARDLENLDDAAVNFLRLAYAIQHMDSMDVSGGATSKQIAKLDKQIKSANNIDRRKLERVKKDLLANKARRERIPAKRAGMEAQMESIYQAFSDIHFQIVANPGDIDALSVLRDATARLQIEEELTMSTDLELAELSTDSDELRKAKARVAAKAKARQ